VPYHQDSALFPFIDQLGRASGFARDDMPAAKMEKLEALLARAAPPDEDVAFLADLMSLPVSDRHPLPNLSPPRKKERTLEALIHQPNQVGRGGGRCRCCGKNTAADPRCGSDRAAVHLNISLSQKPLIHRQPDCCVSQTLRLGRQLLLFVR
jgi:hypothetical protein